MDTAYSSTLQQPRSNPAFHKSLHAARKNPKPWKKPTAPLTPAPPATRVYKVAPIGFKELVQKLTGAGSGHPARRLRAVAPPPLEFASAKPAPASGGCEGDSVVKEKDGSAMTPMSAFFRELSGLSAESSGQGAGLGLGLSPSPRGWFQFPLMSPVPGSTETSTFL